MGKMNAAMSYYAYAKSGGEYLCVGAINLCHNAYWLHLILEHAMKTLVSTMLTIYIVMQKENANGMLKKEKREYISQMLNFIRCSHLHD